MNQARFNRWLHFLYRMTDLSFMINSCKYHIKLGQLTKSNNAGFSEYGWQIVRWNPNPIFSSYMFLVVYDLRRCPDAILRFLM